MVQQHIPTFHMDVNNNINKVHCKHENIPFNSITKKNNQQK